MGFLPQLNEWAIPYTASFPGAPNLDGAFNCADPTVKVPVCCDSVSKKTKTKLVDQYQMIKH
jgi:hypothetical protein